MGRYQVITAAIACALCAACVGEVRGVGGPDGGDGSTGRDARPPTDSALPDGDTALPDGAPRPDTGPNPMPGPCAATSLSEALETTPLEGAGAPQLTFGAGTPDGGAVAAWNGGDGVHVGTVDAAGAQVGRDFVVPGDRPYGLAVATDGTRGLLINRGSDALYLVGTDPGGSIAFESLLIGEVDHGVTNNEWFGSGIRDGRLAWTGSQWAAYYTVQRLWDDGVAHYGDQLRLVNADGSPGSTVWGWGCSHSMEVRLAHDGSNLGPLCASDCFPDKGVFFNHRTMLYTDARANCSGGHTAHLGGIAPITGGFMTAFTAGDGRASEDLAVARIEGGSAGDAIFLTDSAGDEEHPNIAPFEGALVVGWVSGGTSYLQRVTLAGAPVGEPEAVAAASLDAASDFFTYTNGDVGWVIGTRETVTIARLRDCR